MLEYDRVDVSEGIDVNKTSSSRECSLCHYHYFLDINFNYQKYLCNRCHDLIMLLLYLLKVMIIELVFGI